MPTPVTTTFIDHTTVINSNWLNWVDYVVNNLDTLAPGVTDGNKGDITVSSGGDVWTINRAPGTSLTYYVRTDGNDSNDGSANDAAHAFRTLQHTFDVVSKLLAQYQITIQIADGDYSSERYASLNASTFWTTPDYYGLHIRGNPTNPENVNFGRGAGGEIDIAGPIAVLFEGVALDFLYFDNCAGNVRRSRLSQVFAVGHATVFIGTSLTLVGNADSALRAEVGAKIFVRSGGTYTLESTPSYSDAFCKVASGALIEFDNSAFVGTATGKKYVVATSGSIQTGSLTLPGTLTGTGSTGGVYNGVIYASDLEIAGATVTASTPVINASQIWNNAAVVFTGKKTNITNTASAAGSLIEDWQVGGTSQANIDTSGTFNSTNGGFVAQSGTAAFSMGWGTFGQKAQLISNGLSLGGGLMIRFAPSRADQSTDLGLARNAAGLLEVNNGTANAYADLKLRGISTTQVADVTGTITATPSTSGGSLAAGTRYFNIVAMDSLGNPTNGSLNGAGAVVTTGSTSKIDLSWTAAANAASYRVYYGNAVSTPIGYFTTTTNSYSFTTTSGATAGSYSSTNITGGVYVNGGANVGLIPYTNGDTVLGLPANAYFRISPYSGGGSVANSALVAGAPGVYGWASAGSAFNNVDMGLIRVNSSGVGITDGGTTNYRDLTLRNMTANGAVTVSRDTAGSNNAVAIQNPNAAGSSTLAFLSGAGTKAGMAELDSSGNMVFRNTTSGSLYFDGYASSIFRVGTGFSTVMQLSAGGAAINGSSALTGGTVTADAPVINASQTWNAGAVTFTGWKLNVTDTASATASRFLDFQVAGTSKAYVEKSGRVYAQATNYSQPAFNVLQGASLLGGLGTSGSNVMLRYDTNNAMLSVDGAGSITSLPNQHSGLIIADTTVTASRPAIDASQTWNNAAVTFTGWKLNVTNTASNSASLLADLQVGGSSMFKVDRSGYATAVGFLTTSDAYYAASGAYLATNELVMQGTNGAIRFTANSLYSGAKDTGLARNSAKVLEINSGTAGTYSGTALVLGIQTVAQLPTAAAGLKGARATVSDATATTFMSTVAGGGSTIVPVFCNGTNWLIG